MDHLPGVKALITFVSAQELAITLLKVAQMYDLVHSLSDQQVRQVTSD
jgi:hypothetical protein